MVSHLSSLIVIVKFCILIKGECIFFKTKSMNKILNILSLGAGVQSTCVLLMSIKGLLPKIDYCVFADTGFEPPNVYTHFQWLKKFSEDNRNTSIGCPKGENTRGIFSWQTSRLNTIFLEKGYWGQRNFAKGMHK